MEIKAFHHVALHTRNIERAISFYKSMGAVVEDRAVVEKWILALIRWGGVLIELKEPNHREINFSDDGFFNHICVEVNDIDEAVSQLKELGVDSFINPSINEFPGVYGGLKNIFFRGPDGEQIELFQYINR